MIDDLYDARNEVVRLESFIEVDASRKAALARFTRRLGFAYLYPELLEPLQAGGSLLMTAGLSERPWPPSGVGAQSIEGLAFALIGDDRRAFMTPTLCVPEHGTNIGLLCVVTRTLLAELGARGVGEIVYIVHEKSALARFVLEQAGFKATGEQVVTERAGYQQVAASPEAVVSSLGIANMRTGDLLALRLEPESLSRAALFHLALAHAVEGAWTDRLIEPEVLPGIIDWVSSPPGGIGGTPGPKRRPTDGPIFEVPS